MKIVIDEFFKYDILLRVIYKDYIYLVIKEGQQELTFCFHLSNIGSVA